MPTINRKQIRPKLVQYKHDNQSAEYYNSSAWHSLRNDYYSKNPLCQICLDHNVVRVAEHIHHKRPFLRGLNENERWLLFLDEQNLMSVCAACHSKLHTKMKRYGLSMCDELTDVEYEDVV